MVTHAERLVLFLVGAVLDAILDADSSREMARCCCEYLWYKPAEGRTIREMKTIGIGELRAHLSQIIREMQETGEAVEVTYYGAPVARLMSLHRPSTRQERQEATESLDTLAARLSSRWPEGVTALEAVHDVRRDL